MILCWEVKHLQFARKMLMFVEIGVLAPSMLWLETRSKHILEKLPFVNLLGVDPYIGKDGTFPGDFSETLDPDMAFAQVGHVNEFAAAPDVCCC